MPVRGSPVPPGDPVRYARYHGQMHLLRRGARTERLGQGTPALWHEPDRRRQAAALRRSLLDARAPCRGWGGGRRERSRTGGDARRRQRRLGLGNRISSGGRKLMNGRERIRVRGRDFTGYRVAGAIVALIFLVFLIWQIVYLLQGYKVVVPKVSWVAEGTATGAAELSTPESNLLATEILRQRTTLMAGREQIGPAPDLVPPPLALDPDTRLETRALRLRDRSMPRAWSIPEGVASRVMRPSERVEGWTAVPYDNAGLFERPEGRDWRHAMADWAQHYGALAILGMVLLLGIFLAIRGRVPIAEGRDGRTVLRFGFLERSVHWLVAGSFVLLALSGAVIAFGTTLIAPI